MTDTEPTAAELDAWLAEKVMEWTNKSAPETQLAWLAIRPDWHPTTDIAQAFMCLENWATGTTEREGRIVLREVVEEGDWCWEVTLSDPSAPSLTAINLMHDQLPKAICLAMYRMGQAEGEQP